MKFLDLNYEYSNLDWKEILSPIFNNGDFINGTIVKDFENAISKYIGSKYAIGVSSGTDAIKVSIMSLGVKNPVVLTTPYTFFATVEVPISLGCKVIFCDIDKDFNIDINKVKNIIKTKHIDIFIPVHLFGLPCKMDDELISLCKEKNIYIVEDAAQALGSFYNNKHVGLFGDIGCFSFFPSKNLGCPGDGGLIVTNNDKIYEKCVMIKNHGSSKKYEHLFIGGNYRLDTIHAAILFYKLKFLECYLHKRIKNANFYIENLKDINGVVLPFFYDNCRHTFNQFVIRVDNRDGFKDFLEKNNIPTMIYYPKCLSEQGVFSGYDFECDCYNSKMFAKKNIALPIAHLTIDDQKYIVDIIKTYYKDN